MGWEGTDRDGHRWVSLEVAERLKKFVYFFNFFLFIVAATLLTFPRI